MINSCSEISSHISCPRPGIPLLGGRFCPASGAKFTAKSLKLKHMNLLTPKDRKQLLANHAKKLADPTFDPKPIVRLYTLFKPCEWLLTELDPKYPDTALALCDLAMGSVEYGSVSLSELEALTVVPGLPLVERDDEFKAEHTISHYASEAAKAGKIVLPPVNPFKK
jgi:hypothetical protein